MKAALWSIVVSAALLAGCSGKPSPESEITCGTVGSVTFGSPGTYLFQIQKTVTANDPGLGGPVPANGLTASVYAQVEEIEICEGDCLDGDGNFDNPQDVATNDDGILIYTLGVNATGVYQGSVIESFGADSVCTTEISFQ
jgi:hypothetical protein